MNDTKTAIEKFRLAAALAEQARRGDAQPEACRRALQEALENCLLPDSQFLANGPIEEAGPWLDRVAEFCSKSGRKLALNQPLEEIASGLEKLASVVENNSKRVRTPGEVHVEPSSGEVPDRLRSNEAHPLRSLLQEAWAEAERVFNGLASPTEAEKRAHEEMRFLGGLASPMPEERKRALDALAILKKAG